MCLIALARNIHPDYPLILLANREAVHTRPSQAAHWWTDFPQVFGGRDQVAGGSWLAVNRHGRIAAVLNLLEWPRSRRGTRSRGLLVNDCLVGNQATAECLAHICDSASGYAPFRLLVCDGLNAWLLDASQSNDVGHTHLATGLHIVTSLPGGAIPVRGQRLQHGFMSLLQQQTATLPALLDLLGPETADDRSTHTSLSEQTQSALFVTNDFFGTRATTVVGVDHHGAYHFHERTYDSRGKCIGEIGERFARASAPVYATRSETMGCHV